MIKTLILSLCLALASCGAASTDPGELTSESAGPVIDATDIFQMAKPLYYLMTTPSGAEVWCTEEEIVEGEQKGQKIKRVICTFETPLDGS